MNIKFEGINQLHGLNVQTGIIDEKTGYQNTMGSSPGKNNQNNNKKYLEYSP